jgi:hypothetical protein
MCGDGDGGRYPLARVRRPSGDLDDDLAESLTIADAGQSPGRLTQREDCVDVDLDVTRNTHFGQRTEMSRSRLHDQHPDASATEATDEGSDGDDPQKRRHRPSD